ncbi:MAG: MAPEG family protein [Polyangiaceae bacterium]|nr:MAPEG family protein [Polyangiaceae bacterium]
MRDGGRGQRLFDGEIDCLRGADQSDVGERTKYRLKARYEKDGKVFDRYFGQDPEMLAADRAVANTQEQMGPFLASLWLFSIFASPTYATGLGAAYVALRGVYPFLLGKRVSKVQSKRVALVTFPCYAIVFTLLGGAAWAALGGRDAAGLGQSPRDGSSRSSTRR